MSLVCRELEIVTKFMSHIQTDVLLSSDSHPAAGLMYHIADVFVVELKEVCRCDAPSAPVLQALLEPFCQVLAQTNTAAFLPRLRYSLYVPASMCQLSPICSVAMLCSAVSTAADSTAHVVLAPSPHCWSCEVCLLCTSRTGHVVLQGRGV